MSKTTAIIVACLSLGMYAMAQKAGGPPAAMQSEPAVAQPQNQSAQPQQHQPSGRTPAQLAAHRKF